MTELCPPTILVVDDDSITRDFLTHWLTEEGYRCIQAVNADEAWAYLASHEVHLITLDIQMPGRSGMEMLFRVRRAFPETAVVMVTSVRRVDVAIEALTRGAWGYVIKPVERDDVVLHVKRALDRRGNAVDKRKYIIELEQRVRQGLPIRPAEEDAIYRLVAASTCREQKNGASIRRPGLFSEALATAAGWAPAEAGDLSMAAPLRDVGKIAIPDAILRKPGRLTREEFELMKSHTVIGAGILSSSDSPVLRTAQEIALCHHERWGGGGYPAGLAGPAIPESARIVAIVDVYDALTHDRAYRPALGESEALATMLEGRGTYFEPRLLDLFLAMLPDIRRIGEDNPDDPALAPQPETVDSSQPGIELHVAG
ncbi:MAG: HD domain-containing phosphohydrolase [Pirellulales bacterium]